MTRPEIIDTLSRKCWMGTYFDFDLFAELIVTECCQVMLAKFDDPLASHAIFEHFYGINETAIINEVSKLIAEETLTK